VVRVMALPQREQAVPGDLHRTSPPPLSMPEAHGLAGHGPSVSRPILDRAEGVSVSSGSPLGLFGDFRLRQPARA
jgi:hypothetical protein